MGNFQKQYKHTCWVSDSLNFYKIKFNQIVITDYNVLCCLNCMGYLFESEVYWGEILVDLSQKGESHAKKVGDLRRS